MTALIVISIDTVSIRFTSHLSGIFRIILIAFSSVRFIPALAGNILPSANAYPYSKVHPRSRREYVDSIRENLSNQGSPRIRGEYEKASGTSGWYYGSPPHPRGISAVLRLLAVDYRFTPASARNMSAFTDDMDHC